MTREQCRLQQRNRDDPHRRPERRAVDARRCEQPVVATAAGLRAANWARQKSLGINVIPSNDFSFYDQVLDTSVMVGAIPEIYRWKGGQVSLATYFAMARGSQAEAADEACAHGPHARASRGASMTTTATARRRRK